MRTLQTISGLPIGFRRARSLWQQDLSALLTFAVKARFAFLDFGPIDADTACHAQQQGLPIGTADLIDWPSLLSLDDGLRVPAVLANASHLRSLVGVGVTKFLTMLTPPEPSMPRRESFAQALVSYRSLGKAAEECGAKILIEGAPGRPPYFANLACTPADLRAFLSAVDSPAIGVNYDPSHLVRMGIDPLRFLKEFALHVHHVHAKDTLFIDAEQYDHGTVQQATFAQPHLYGGFGWRYALPGKGAIDWQKVLGGLKEIGYAGGISIELEDEEYLGSPESEQRGLLEAASVLCAG